MTNSVADRFISKIRGYKKIDRVRGIRASVYTTYNEVWIYVLYSGGTKQGKYWFGIDTRNVEEWSQQKSVIFCFLCGDEDTVAFVPDHKLVEWFKGVEPNRKGQWMITIALKNGKLTLHASAERQFDLTPYLNRFDFISKTIPVPAQRQMIRKKATDDSSDVIDAIKSNPDLSGDSLHDRVIDMIAQIGKWSGYVPAKGCKVPPDSPYAIDIVWLERDLIELAVEVQVGGNETEAKDRLVHAKRFGARKIVVVSKAESIKRLKEICRYEPELKNWLEIWSLSKVYRMYLAGQQFFDLFQPFERQEWSKEIREVLMVYEVLYYNGWVEPGAYYLMGSAEGDSAEEAAQVSLTGITIQVRETFRLDPADVEDAQIQETLYLVPREGLIPLRTFARPS